MRVGGRDGRDGRGGRAGGEATGVQQRGPGGMPGGNREWGGVVARGGEQA